MSTWSRMTRLLWAHALLFLALSASQGCSSDGENSAGSEGRQCRSGEDCPLWSCVCKDGANVSMPSCAGTHCQDGSTACGNACASRGGLESFREKPTVKDSPECKAYCAKGASLGCGAEPRCDRLFYCDVEEDECAEAKRAHLQCVVEQGIWTCSGSGGWEVTSGCPSARCAMDAGAD